MIAKQDYNIVATIEARMTSSRLPGKVLMEAGGKPLLQIMIERVQRASTIDQIIVATTVNKQDDPIVALCENLGISYYRGSELNVLERVCNTLRTYNADIDVELTADCPLVDAYLIDDCVNQFLNLYPSSRYVSNSARVPWGLDVRAFMAKDLFQVEKAPLDALDTEHVSYHFYRPESGENFNPVHLTYQGEVYARPDMRITLDYFEDYTLIKSAYEFLSRDNLHFTSADVIRFVDLHPELHNPCIIVREHENNIV